MYGQLLTDQWLVLKTLPDRTGIVLGFAARAEMLLDQVASKGRISLVPVAVQVLSGYKWL